MNLESNININHGQHNTPNSQQIILIGNSLRLIVNAGGEIANKIMSFKKNSATQVVLRDTLTHLSSALC